MGTPAFLFCPDTYQTAGPGKKLQGVENFLIRAQHFAPLGGYSK